jgi:sporulation protein YlmC with PRC-barrel domain
MGNEFIRCEGAELCMRLNARVQAGDQAPVGFVHWVVVDSSSFAVAGLVVAEPGLLARQVLVSPAHVEAATPEGEALRLRIGRHDLEALPDHTPDDYLPPAPSWTDALRLGLGASAYVATEGHSAQARAALKHGYDVTDRAGRRLGRAEGLCLIPRDGRLAAIVARPAEARRGLSSHETYRLPADWLMAIGEGRVQMRVELDDVVTRAERMRPRRDHD